VTFPDATILCPLKTRELQWSLADDMEHRLGHDIALLSNVPLE